MRNKLCGYSLFIYRMLAVTSFLCSFDFLIRIENMKRTNVHYADLQDDSTFLCCEFSGSRWCSAPTELCFAFCRIGILVFSCLIRTWFFQISADQTYVALVHCMPSSEKLCNYCDISLVNIFFIEMYSWWFRNTWLFYNCSRLPVALKLEYSK